MDLEQYKNEGIKARKNIDTSQIKKIADGIINSFRNNGKLIVFGNGGSAADAQHFVAELTGHYMKERKALPAIALTTNTSALTAIGNDYSYNDIFSRQVQALCKKEDYVVGISTSGNSKNVVAGIEEANSIGAFTLGFTGKSGGKLAGICRDVFHSDSDITPIIQEIHITAIHMICAIIDGDF
ncbi:D-sedoheptulose 7-phosphate isomerase [Ferroplasma acidarmanus]|uniref:Probable phosphoheptose isomerase n=1 Tax=Ferroplasma acidarmanus Fer1 TaxID=333146 RepID=S0ALV6_FERAC|nr:D-sedoheptulose 7-phosphate isomerase [Ferroplasma acidarmanus]AGO60273.1 phosphoheptose isomerase [Ferroplasma acidarmanus Fer1]